MTRIITLFVVILLVVGCQTTSEALKQYPVGASYSGEVLIGKKQIPLPPGDWEIFASKIKYNSSQLPFVSLILGNKDRQSPALALHIHSNLEASWSGNGLVVYRYCSRTNMHHVFDRDSLEGGEQECWFVNHSRMTRPNVGGSNVLVAGLERAKKLGVKLPVTAITAGFRFANSYDLLNLRIYFNPEAEGFDPPKQSAWATNDWHKDRIYTDQKKVAYVEKVKKWAEEFFPKVEAGFKGKLAPARTAAK
jgi:hypothetical protein